MKALATSDSQADMDAEEVLRLVREGKRVTDPELRRRIRERAESIRDAIEAKYGVLDVAVNLIRETRDE
jgi:hypothetical protein